MRHNKNNLLSLYIYPEVLHVRAPPAPSAASSAPPLHLRGHDLVSNVISFFFFLDKQLLSPGRQDDDVGHKRHFDKN